MNKRLVHLIWLFCLMSSACSLNALTVKAFKLKNTLPYDIWVKGKVLPMRSGYMHFQNPGNLTFIVTEGTPARGPQYDKGGEEIRPGTLLAQQDRSLYEIEIKIKERLIDAAKADLETSLREYNRMKMLIEKKAVSTKAYDDSEGKYLNILAELAKAQRELEKAKYNLSKTSMYAPFDGIVEKVNYPVGSFVGDDNDILKLTMVSILKVQLNIPYELSRMLTMGKSTDVYPPNSNVPVPGWFHPSLLRGAKACLYIRNYRKPLKALSEDELCLPRITDFWGVQRLFDAAENTLHVPLRAVHKDKDGSFVWQLEGQKAYDGKGLPRIVKVKKVPVKAGKKIYAFPYGEYYEIKNSSLHIDDLLAVWTSGELKDNGEAVVLHLRWVLIPNQTVDVRLPELLPRGFYIPRRFIFKDDKDNDFFFSVDKRRKLTRVYVKTSDVLGSLVRVSAPGLSVSMPVITSITDADAVDMNEVVKIDFLSDDENYQKCCGKLASDS